MARSPWPSAPPRALMEPLGGPATCLWPRAELPTQTEPDCSLQVPSATATLRTHLTEVPESTPNEGGWAKKSS